MNEDADAAQANNNVEPIEEEPAQNDQPFEVAHDASGTD